ncbi:MAG: hypothetical protein U0263_17465 [Polyangiaceae bacterium]
MRSAACARPAKVGSACSSDGDCLAANYCDFVSEKCGAQVALGGDCPNSEDCVKKGAHCDSATQKCVADLASGGSCSSSSDCQTGLICGASKQCKKPALGGPNAACDPTESQSCNQLLGLGCDETDALRHGPHTHPGEPCTGYSNGRRHHRRALLLGWCAANHTSGPDTCVVPAADGATCSDSDGPLCSFPSKCVNGKCTLPSSSACGVRSPIAQQPSCAPAGWCALARRMGATGSSAALPVSTRSPAK